MNKIKNTIKYCTILGVFTLLALAGTANADYNIVTPGPYSNYAPVYQSPAYNYTTPQPYYTPAPTVVYTEPNPVAYVNYTPSSTANIYSSSTNPNATSTPKTVAKAKTTTTATNTVAKIDTSTNSGLAASAVFGSSGFLPSGIIQWILFAILVLLIVILARKIYGADEAYNTAPMKHD